MIPPHPGSNSADSELELKMKKHSDKILDYGLVFGSRKPLEYRGSTSRKKKKTFSLILLLTLQEKAAGYEYMLEINCFTLSSDLFELF